jgi:uncharacterized Ntn-hydrolase superfamily protein
VTYSIVARDGETGELGVAVQSRAFNTGAACAWALPGVGAVATQSFTERGYGPRGLERMAAGQAPADALAELLAEDEQSEFRQVAFLAADGRTAAHTGAACIDECGDLAQENVSAQGNMLASAGVWPAMVEAFEAARGPLAERLLAALDAAEAAGGDFRGRQAGGLVVVSGDRDDPPWKRIVDVRVDDHPEPLAELRRLTRLAAAYRARAELTPDETREAGMRPDEVELSAALAALRAGDEEECVLRLRGLLEAQPRWRQAYVNYERLGLFPAGLVSKL